MTFGVDYAWGRPGPIALEHAGVHFAARYLSHDRTGKDLTRAEAQALTDAGISLVCVWETSANEALNGYGAGRTDAWAAVKEAYSCGMPKDRPIYFAVDFDSSQAQQAAINAYLDGAASVMGKGATGIYGGYWPVKRAMDGGHCAFGWQTYAWSAGQWYPKAQLQQYSNDHIIGGVGLDYDRSTAKDYGQWTVGGVTPKPGPPPKPGTAPPFPGRVLSQPPIMNGADVLVWQRQMAHRGWRITADGAYGPASDAVCRAFQAEKGLSVDGKVGPLTWAASWKEPVT